MINSTKYRQYIATIENYRHALWVHKYNLREARQTYKATVIRDASVANAFKYIVYDTWIDTSKPNDFCEIRKPVPGLFTQHEDAQQALDELLRLTKNQFINDACFEST